MLLAHLLREQLLLVLHHVEVLLGPYQLLIVIGGFLLSFHGVALQGLEQLVQLFLLAQQQVAVLLLLS